MITMPLAHVDAARDGGTPEVPSSLRRSKAGRLFVACWAADCTKESSPEASGRPTCARCGSRFDPLALAGGSTRWSATEHRTELQYGHRPRGLVFQRAERLQRAASGPVSAELTAAFAALPDFLAVSRDLRLCGVPSAAEHTRAWCKPRAEQTSAHPGLDLSRISGRKLDAVHGDVGFTC